MWKHYVKLASYAEAEVRQADEGEFAKECYKMGRENTNYYTQGIDRENGKNILTKLFSDPAVLR